MPLQAVDVSHPKQLKFEANALFHGAGSCDQGSLRTTRSRISNDAKNLRGIATEFPGDRRQEGMEVRCLGAQKQVQGPMQGARAQL